MSDWDTSEELMYRYAVGIDLGTTNSAVAYVDLENTPPPPEPPRIRVFNIPQLVTAGEVGRRSLLPSFLYLPGKYDLPQGAAALPWDPQRPYIVGEFAREQGALVPGRLVSSAKSWLCHGSVDREAPILPWGAGDDVPKVSPVEASARYLQHIREAWNHGMARGRDECLLEEQLVVLTVPASFDEVARELTVEAASKAGLRRVILLEEPLAAFYSWLARHVDRWEERMAADQIVLVCDVGGGTTDFSIIAVRRGEKGLRFDRLAVGDHLMLGGDNMDLTLARYLEMELMGAPGKLDVKRWHQLTHGCRRAKETLLAEDSSEEHVDVTVMGTGRRLIADTLKGTLTRSQVEEWILDGFFPEVDFLENPQTSQKKGITEFGLPYVQDPAVTKHLSSFWRRHESLIIDETGRKRPHPDFILFNGGALIPASVRERIRRVLGRWFEDRTGEGWRPRELENPHPDLAVAFGAAYYAMVRLGVGVRVGAGTPRTYYVEVAGPESGIDECVRAAVCLIPRGTEEGYEGLLESPTFEVLTNRPATFQVLSSHTRLGDKQGDMVHLSDEEITVLPPIRTALRYGKKSAPQRLPVQIGMKLTEVGTLELWCQSLKTPHRWQLRFDVRQQGDEPCLLHQGIAETVEEKVLEEAKARIVSTFQKGASGSGSSPEKLVKTLVEALDMPKHQWATPVIRSFADVLIQCREGRTMSPEHEARWWNLTGYCLRPGYGDPVDEWRMREVWKLYPKGVCHHRQTQCRLEWWIFWRRVAGGLNAGKQWHIYQQLAPALLGSEKKKKGKKKAASRLSPQEQTEAWMTLGNFERLPVETKEVLGRRVLARVLVKKPRPQDLWTLTRLGARQPFYGPVDRVVLPETVSDWIGEILNVHPVATDALAHVVVHLARKTGDRARDISPALIDRILRWLDPLEETRNRFRDLLSNPESPFQRDEESWLFGETLPLGLKLADEKSRTSA